MFDISFGELMLIGVIALVVIGPQRLPTVARTLGHLIGRAQRYVNDVKHDIQKEIDLEELNKVKNQMESAARSVQSSVQEVGSSLSKPIEEAQQAMHEASKAVQGSLNLDPSNTDPNTDATPATTPTATSAQTDAKVQTSPEAQMDLTAAAVASAQTTHVPTPSDAAVPDATTQQNQEPST